MLHRCKDKNNEKYGGRGIVAFEEWQEFKNFKIWALNNGYSDDLSIDRKDNNGNYCPENCRWIPIIEQANNKTNTRLIEINGEIKSIHDWCRYFNINYVTVIRRIKKEGFSEYEALTKMLHPGRTKLHTINGTTKSLLQWCKFYNMPYKTVDNRLRRGIQLEEALKTKGRLYG
jgi:hypothetical protein